MIRLRNNHACVSVEFSADDIISYKNGNTKYFLITALPYKKHA